MDKEIMINALVNGEIGLEAIGKELCSEDGEQKEGKDLCLKIFILTLN